MSAVNPMAETIVLVHGLYTHGLIMALLAKRLRRLGYRTVSFSYPSVRRTPAQNARALQALVLGLRAPIVHCLAHSLGGLVLRHLFAHHESLPPGRVVTLGTPHQGSRVAQALCDHRFGFILGRSVDQGLLDGVPGWPEERELGCMAGTLNVGLGRLVSSVPEPADGTVAVVETQVPGMTDHICLPVTHTSMLFARTVVVQVHHFLTTGQFRRDAGEGLGSQGRSY